MLGSNITTFRAGFASGSSLNSKVLIWVTDKSVVTINWKEKIMEANIVLIQSICWVATWFTGVIMFYFVFREEK